MRAGPAGEFATADLCDEHGSAAAVCAPSLTDFGGVRCFAGLAVTVKCLDDNSRVREVLAETGEGRVLVVDGGGSTRCALLGDRLAALALENGWAGVVIDGCVRDSAQLTGVQLGIKARSAHPRASEKRGQGIRDIPVHVAGVLVRPGDRVYSDPDGVVFISGEAD